VPIETVSVLETATGVSPAKRVAATFELVSAESKSSTLAVYAEPLV